MTPEIWREVRRILETALELRADEREGFLDTACPEPELRREVESLLAVEEAAEGFIEIPAIDLHAEQDGSSHHTPGQQVGRYRLVAEIGRGGMGRVFLATRADGDFDQRVAVKVLKRGIDTDEVVARFRAERQILARLEHPNIARLIDGGTTEDGLPFLVMEHVEGVRIDEYCDARHLPLPERLRLIQTVCGVVHFAHQNLVVHRDLKPTNVLVTEAGLPKLLDFGIAKLLDPDVAGAGQTRRGQERCTPEYAAPEQIHHGPITTATDVYGLGALLYELLAGRPPHAPRSERRTETATAPQDAAERPSLAFFRKPAAGDGRQILTAEEISARRGCDPPRLQRALERDLDNIVLKALAPDPKDRYSSAEQLAEDLQRHLEGLPVRARRASLSYRAGRFLGRHRLATVTAALVATLIVGFGVRERQLRSTAEGARLEAESVSDFLVGTLAQADPARSTGREVSVREMLGSAVARIRSDDSLEPEVRAELLDTMGRSYLGLGHYEQAFGLLGESLEIRRVHLGADHLQVAESHYRLFQLHYERRNDAEAERHVREALAVRRRRGAIDHPNYAKALNGLAQILERRGELDEAEKLHQENLTLKRRLLGEDHPDVATTLHNLAGIHLARGDAESAARHFRQALDLRQRSFEGPNRHVAATLNGLAAALEAGGDLEAAEQRYRSALGVQRQLYPAGHPTTAVTLNNLGALLSRTGDPKAAEPILREALSIQDRFLLPDHPQRAVVLRNLAEVLASTGEGRAAEGLAREALEIFKHAQTGTHWRVADAESVIGAALAAQNRFEEAEPLLVGGFLLLRQAQGDGSRYTRDALARLTRFLEETGQDDRVLSYAGSPQRPGDLGK